MDNGFHYEGKIDSKRRVALPAALRERALSFGSSNLYFQDSDSAEYYSDIFIVVDQTPRVSDLTNFNKAPE
ncbi:MraZ N-terminal domain containing protein [Candidatus Saccharibacteria bacterium]|nr:MraZ N-terminal domain containing protein [Candidatus Saccharibacteria bacterium]